MQSHSAWKMNYKDRWNQSKKKKIAPQKDACWKGISIDVRHEQCNKTAIGGDKKNFLELLRTIF